jgi:antitoxin component YwqK of YwqJK toxin-antitoxin module
LISYYPNKQIETKGFYNQNKKEGLWLSYYENGNKKDSAFYKKNNPCGISYEWFENGKISIEREMDTLGTGTGKEISYWDNNNKDYEGTWLNGKRNGYWAYYHFNGQMSLEANYENNTMKKTKCYNESGIEETICDTNKIKGQIFKLAKNITPKQYWERGLNKLSWNKDVPFYSSGINTWIELTITREGKIKNATILHGSIKSVNIALLELANNLPIIEPAYKFNRKIDYTFTQKTIFKM